MKTKCTSLLVAAVAAVAFAGCTSDDDFAPQRESSGVKQSLTFTANVNGGGAKCYAYGRQKTHLMTDGCSVAFDAGDAISVFDGVGNNNAFTTQDEGATATFMGEAVETANYTALYPYQEGASLDGTTLTAALPMEQNAVLDSYDPKANLSVATTTKEAMSFGFKNVCALVKFETTEPLTKVVLQGNSNENVAGTLSIDMSNADAPTVTGSAPSITLLPAEGETAISAGTYYIAVLPQTFVQGFTIASYKEGSETADRVLRIDESITLTRSSIIDFGSIVANGHEYVDLGIEVDGYKVLWATTNVGATTPEAHGDYFAWGVTTPYYQNWSGSGNPTSWKDGKSGYGWQSYCGQSGFKEWNPVPYDENLVLKPEYDAAHVNWGGDWVMPTIDEWGALKNATLSNGTLKATWTTKYNGTTVNGYVITNKSDTSKSIFLPAVGRMSSKSFMNNDGNGYYWSSTHHETDANACGFQINSGNISNSYNSSRYYGLPIRPVLRIPVSQ